MPLSHLPIDSVLPEVQRVLRSHAACVLQAPPGAGKTTRVPIALLEQVRGDIVMLEPRRLATRAAATSLARNLGEPLGRTVGYKVRFDEVGGRDTRLWVVTEGILTRRFTSDAFLSGVGCVILDEIHERSVFTDVALAFLRELLEVRDDLKVVAMSATLDAAQVSQFLHNAPVVTSEGRPHPVAIRHVDKRDPKPLDEQVAAAVRQMMLAPDDDGGDVLVFLPGTADIRRAAQRLDRQPLPGGARVLQLHGGMSPAEQDRVLAPMAERRVILATNVAETSLTIDGLTTVIDSGFAKIARFDSASDREHLETVRISLSSAQQRAGRAGRQRPGRALRLWTTVEHAQLRDNHAPEIARVDLARVILDVMQFHPGDPRQFAFLETPPAAALERALALLASLGALDVTRTRLSPFGERLARLPLHPRTGALLLRCGADSDEVAFEAAVLEDDRLHPTRPALHATDSDVAVLVEDLKHGPAARELEATARSLRRQSARSVEDGSRKDALICAFLDRLCVRRKPGEPEARMVGGRGVTLAAQSGVKDAPLFLALALDGKGKSGSVVTIAEGVSIDEVAHARPDAVSTTEEATFDTARGVLVGVRRTRVLDLIVEEKSGIALSDEAKRMAVASAVRSDLTLLRWSDDVDALLRRIKFAQAHLVDASWPDCSEQALCEFAADACSDSRSMEQARALPWRAMLWQRLSYQAQRLLDAELPERIGVPSGSMIALTYPTQADDPPVLAVRLQELFGLADGPRVARGAVPVLLHLLSPGHKPVQVTRDLKSFWSTTYPQVKKELLPRYPRHSWPDDPWTATPTSRAKRRGT